MKMENLREENRYDAAGRSIYAQYEDNLGQAYSYDNAGQVKNVKVNTANPATTNATASPTHAYNYDSAGNRTSSLDNGLTTNYSSNSVNAYTSMSSGGILPPNQNPTYDPNGNMLTRPVGAPVSGGSSLSYDKENRLRTISTGPDTVSHTYDALGRLIQTDTTAATDNRERYTWAGWTLLTREIFTGTASTSTHRYTWGLDLSGSMEGAGGVGGLLALERNVTGNSTWDIRYPHNDANGNIIALSLGGQSSRSNILNFC
jgi:YD repeat-containing protein